LKSISNLIATIRLQGSPEEAHRRESRLLNVMVKALGDNPPETLVLRGRLAEATQAGDRATLAEISEQQEKILQALRKELGAQHPHTVQAMAALARTLYAQWNLSGARVLQELVLAIQKRAPGEEHPATLSSMNHLAATLRALAESTDAPEFSEQVASAEQEPITPHQGDTLMPQSIFLSYVYEDHKHRDDVIHWVQTGRLGPNFVTVTESEDVRPQGESAIENHLKPKIRGAAVVLALIGQDTHSHDWVHFELKVATSLNKRVILAQVPGTTGPAPEDFRHLPIVPLNPEALAKVLSP
ncbi:MAG TPA: TIR domain-containing protein, partial [Hyalangium sp.]|nr:TIR domain-containing protein [Hyalangium sp.]